jgi:hypothetical protein
LTVGRAHARDAERHHREIVRQDRPRREELERAGEAVHRRRRFAVDAAGRRLDERDARDVGERVEEVGVARPRRDTACGGAGLERERDHLHDPSAGAGGVVDDGHGLL